MSPVGQSSRGRKMKAFKDQLKQVSQELEGTKSLLQAVARETGVNFIDEEDDDQEK